MYFNHSIDILIILFFKTDVQQHILSLWVWPRHWLAVASLGVCWVLASVKPRVSVLCQQMNYLWAGRREGHQAWSWRDPDTSYSCISPGGLVLWGRAGVVRDITLTLALRCKGWWQNENSQTLRWHFYISYLHRDVNIVSCWGPNCWIVSNVI